MHRVTSYLRGERFSSALFATEAKASVLAFTLREVLAQSPEGAAGLWSVTVEQEEEQSHG